MVLHILWTIFFSFFSDFPYRFPFLVMLKIHGCRRHLVAKEYMIIHYLIWYNNEELNEYAFIVLISTLNI